MAKRPKRSRKTLPRRTQYYFDQFTNDGGAWNWHWADVCRFRTFIHAAHKGRVKLSAPEVEKLLVARGFGKDDASDLAEWYDFGRELLRERPAFNYIGPNRIGP